MNKVCSIDGCERFSEKRGWCSMHWKRWYRNGDPLKVQRIRGDDDARIESYIERTPLCWNWTGPKNDLGYGRIGIGEGVERKKVYAHALMYERLIGPVPKGMELDHLCRNTSCVNPSHLEPVTHAENVLRGQSPQALNARKTHCVNGHEFTPENTYSPPAGGRSCRICIAARTKAWNLKQKGLAYAN